MPGRAIRKDQRGNKHGPSVWFLLDTEGENRRRRTEEKEGKGGGGGEGMKGRRGVLSLQFQRVESNI